MKNKIIQLYVEENKTMTEIQNILDIDRHIISDILKSNGINKINRFSNINLFTTFESIDNLKQKGIYKITNKENNKIYIGSTTSSFLKRWAEHKMDLVANKHSNSYLQRSFNKYGLNSFEFKIIKLLDNGDDIIWYENFYIKLYNVIDKNIGYNLCPTATESSVNKKKAVYKLDLEGNILEKYDSIKEAEEENKVFNIYKSCNDYRLIGNFYWAYVDAYNKNNYKIKYFYVFDVYGNIILKTHLSSDIKKLLSIDRFQFYKAVKNSSIVNNHYIQTSNNFKKQI